MTDAEITEMLDQAQKWSRDELDAYVNATNWLYAAAAGLIPHGDVSCPHASPAATTSKNTMTLPSQSGSQKSTMNNAGSTEVEPNGTSISTDTVKETTHE